VRIPWEHQEKVDILLRGLDDRLGDGVVERYCGALNSAQAAVASWRLHIPALGLSYDEIKLRAGIVSFRKQLGLLASAKQAKPMESVSTDGFAALSEAWATLLRESERINGEIENAASAISAYQRKLSGENIGGLERKLSELNAAKVRFDPRVIAEFKRLETLEADKKSADREKIEAKKRLDQVLETTLGNLQGRLNALLAKFGASFQVEALRHHP